MTSSTHGRIRHLERVSIANGAVAYSDGDQVGSVLTLSAVRTLSEGSYQRSEGAIIAHCGLVDLANQCAQIDFFVFESDPSVTISSGDNDAFAITDVGMGLCAGFFTFYPVDYCTTGSQSVAHIEPMFHIQTLHADNKIYVVPVIRSAVTYGANELELKVHFDQS